MIVCQRCDGKKATDCIGLEYWEKDYRLVEHHLCGECMAAFNSMTEVFFSPSPKYKALPMKPGAKP